MLYLPYTIEFGLWTVYQLSHTCFQWTVLLDDGHVAQRGVAGCTFGFTSGWAGAIVAGGLLAWSVMSCSSAQCCLSDEFTCLVKSTGIRRIRDYWYPLDPSGSLWIPLEIKDGHGKSLELELEDHGTSGQLEDVPVPVLSLVAHLMIHFGAYWVVLRSYWLMAILIICFTCMKWTLQELSQKRPYDPTICF